MADKLKIKATVDNLKDVSEFIEERMNAKDPSPKTSMQIMVAVEELYVNIAHYAYDSDGGEAEITVDFDGDDNMIISFADWGKPYDPLARQDPDVTLGAEERQIGGLGVYMVKKSMDKFEYRYEDGKNISTIVKKLP